MNTLKRDILNLFNNIENDSTFNKSNPYIIDQLTDQLCTYHPSYKRIKRKVLNRNICNIMNLKKNVGSIEKDVEESKILDEEENKIDTEENKIVDTEENKIVDIEESKLVDIEESKLVDIEESKLADIEESKIVNIEEHNVGNLENSKPIIREKSKLL